MASKQIIFGHIPNIDVGAVFKNYSEMNKVGLHRQTQAGISGSQFEGADSIIVSGGYEDDQDFGDEIIFTGQGGQNPSGKHIKNQELTRGNLALVKNEFEGLPLRVIRGVHAASKFAPLSGYRYDGLYRVDSHWSETGKSGFKVWRYRLLRINNDLDLPQKTSPLIPIAPGLNTNPIRKLTEVQRIVRDTKQAKNIKKHYEYRCQVCDIKIETIAGLYAEAAHIKPLGSPHNGPDTPENIICLCPNHHVMFDLGAFSIQDDFSLIGIEGVLTVSKGHQINLDYFKYHREHYFNKIK